MKITYKNQRLEKAVISVNTFNSAVIIATFVMLLGFSEPLISVSILHAIQIFCLITMITEKFIRYLNCRSKHEFFRGYWHEIPLLILLVLSVIFIRKFSHAADPVLLMNRAVAVYLIIQVVDKLCRTSVSLAASATSPTLTLILSFLVLIVGGAGFLYLPNSHNCEKLSAVDALFTSTSAVCVTGLIVKDTGVDFSAMGQWVILILIQLGGLGIVIFGAVFSLLLGQAFTLKESVAMQDILNTGTVNKIGRMIAFIFVATIIIESVGVILLLDNWNFDTRTDINGHGALFYSLFHSVSAFCNAGFALYSDSFTGFKNNWQTYLVICPLIVTGGLGFGVLYNITEVLSNRWKLIKHRLFKGKTIIGSIQLRHLNLHSKVVLFSSLFLILLGTAGFMILERYNPQQTGLNYNGQNGQLFLDSFFQSVTTRTAGFNTIDNGAISQPSKMLTIILMCIGGSPGSTAGGMKTVTFMVVILAAAAVISRKNEPEIFHRSIQKDFISRAVMVLVLYIAILFIVTFGLAVTESGSGLDFNNLAFEAASALGTVGLSTGLTASLSTGGKLLLIAAMIIGRLGPMTLVASLAFKIKKSNYNYPSEPITIG
ncbi:Ktr system potassium uptake protein B [Limihaloglobus sulfuriphilus]|uniref:Ktr system potassium uptake protein B n=1 Tax=Limihaloglobus sulfuriphilus TaxID=1851148 RepID=A0A1Q2MDR9_9BACT|nr:potassium transporter TrkG [Limihaloglobus sulfuriphilus]AQQ70457.1 Ktr system potassium uptake protein B [Limihaloglobus sulfuriphilus]